MPFYPVKVASKLKIPPEDHPELADRDDSIPKHFPLLHPESTVAEESPGFMTLFCSKTWNQKFSDEADSPFAAAVTSKTPEHPGMTPGRRTSARLLSERFRRLSAGDRSGRRIWDGLDPVLASGMPPETLDAYSLGLVKPPRLDGNHASPVPEDLHSEMKPAVIVIADELEGMNIISSNFAF